MDLFTKNSKMYHFRSNVRIIKVVNSYQEVSLLASIFGPINGNNFALRRKMI